MCKNGKWCVKCEVRCSHRAGKQKNARNYPEKVSLDTFLTSSLKKRTFYNLLINNILYLCVT